MIDEQEYEYEDVGDSGRYDLPAEDIRGIVVALLTSSRESPELGRLYLQGTFPSSDVDDFASAFRAMGNIVGQLVEIVNSLRRVEVWQPYLDQFIRDIALQNSDEH